LRKARHRGSDGRQLALEYLLDSAGIRSSEPILGAQVGVGPQRRIARQANFGDPAPYIARWNASLEAALPHLFFTVDAEPRRIIAGPRSTR
jgi:hypothetical protein